MPNLPAMMGTMDYLLEDRFTVHHEAGAVNGTFATDGKNIRTVVDTYAATELLGNPWFETAGTNGGTISGSRTVNRARTGGVATLEVTAHGFVSTNVATIASMTDASYNATNAVLTRIDNDHFTYPNAGGDEVETVDAAGVVTTAVVSTWTISTPAGGLLSRDAAVFHGGASALKATRVTATAYAYLRLTVIPGFTYTLLGWDYGDGTNSGRLEVNDVSHGTTLMAAIATGHTAAAWAQFTYSLSIPAGCSSIDVFVETPAANGSFCYFDDVSLKPTSGLLQISNLYDALGLQERVYNGGFETAGAGGAATAAGWTFTAGDGAITRTTTAGEFRSGAAGCKAVSGATSNTRGAETFQVIPGLEYTLSFWTRGDGANVGRFYLYDLVNGTFLTNPTTGIAGVIFSLYTRNFVAPANCTSISLALQCPLVNGGIAYFDDISVKQATTSAERRLVVLGGKATGEWGDPGLWYAKGEARVPGKALLIRDISLQDATTNVMCGWDSAATGVQSVNALWFTSDTLKIYDSGSTGPAVAVPTDTTRYDLAIILRATGAAYFWRVVGTQTWTLLWVSGTNNTATVYPGISGNTAIMRLGG